MSRIVVVTAPQPLLQLDAAKAHLRVDHDDEGGLITAAIAAVSAHLDGPDGWLGWALKAQRLELRDSMLDDGVVLRCGPVGSVVSVGYLDADGVDQILPADRYDLFDDRLYRRIGASWPAMLHRDGAVRVQYDAGPAPDHILAIVDAAAKLMVEDLYRFRGSVVSGAIAEVPMSVTVKHLLNPIRRWIG